MKKRNSTYLLTICLIPVFFLMIGCGSAISGTGGTKEDLATDFNNDDAANKLKDSVIEIPDNMKLVSVASSGKKSKEIIEDSYAVAIYGSIRLYVNFSDFLKESVEGFLAEILENKILAFAEPNKINAINDGSDLTGFKIEDVANTSSENYKWKLSLYFKNENSPRLIYRFTFVGDKAKGQMLADIREPLILQVNGVTTTIEKNYMLAITFDGTQTVQKLEIDISQDLTQIMAFGEANWANMTEEQKETLDLSQASKISLRVQNDGNEYGISGSTYSPGQHLKTTLSGEDEFLDANRSSYTFRAKSITGAVDGAKMDVALPVDTLDDINNIWENDSFSSIFRSKILTGFNLNLNSLIDNNDDADLDLTDTVDFSGSTLEEQRIGFQTLYWMLDDKLPIATLVDHGIVMTAAEYTNAENFWGPSFFISLGVSDVDGLNNFMSSGLPDVTDVIKKGIYYLVMAPEVVSYYQTNSVALTIADLDGIINKSDDGNDNVFRDTFQTLSHFVNPAFFEKDRGFLGTYDGENFFEFNKLTNTLSLGVKPTNFDALNVLDLSLLSAIKPNDVYNLTIEVK